MEFQGERYVSSGGAAPLDNSRMQRIGDHHGFAVYAESAKNPGAIYLPVTRDSGELVARYTRQRPR